MGYTTSFKGAFKVEPTMTFEHAAELTARIDQEEWNGRQTPGSCCQWNLTEDRASLAWDQEEKFYNYVEWIEFLAAFLAPKGYTVSGSVQWRGEDFSDSGVLSIENGKAIRAPLPTKAWASVPERSRNKVVELMQEMMTDPNDEDEADAWAAALAMLGVNMSEGQRR